MTPEFEKFNRIFPDSQYRKIHEQYVGTDRELYQAAKAPISRQICSFDDLRDWSGRVGWVIPRGFIVVDIDNKAAADAVIRIVEGENVNCCVNRGLHGAHFIFRTSSFNQQVVAKMCALGISIDTRAAERGYIILPENDTDREWTRLTDLIQQIPAYLIPLRELRNDTNFVGMDEGSRNDSLFRHFMNLKDYASEIDDGDKAMAIRLINKYLLKTPLSENDLNQTVLRAALVEIPSSGKKGKGKFDLEMLAEMICEEFTFITVDDVLYEYPEGGTHYERRDDKWLERVIHDRYAKRLFDAQRKEVIKFVKIKTYLEPSKLNAHWDEICVHNGILNISNLTLKPHSSNEYNTNYVDWDWEDTPRVSFALDEYIHFISNDDYEKVNVLYEMLGDCFLRRSVFQKFYMIYGTGNTGKSTLLRIIQNLVGVQNTSHLSFNDLEEQYLTNELSGKLVNLGDDINFKGLTDTSVLKKLVSGETMTVNRKFMMPCELTNFATLIFTTNQLPPVNDHTTGFSRRLRIIDINRPIENPKPLFVDNLNKDDYNWLFVKAIKAIHNALKRGDLSTCTSCEIIKTQYLEANQASSILFCIDNGYDSDSINRMPCGFMYSEYREYAKQNGYTPVSRTTFQLDICRKYDMERRNTTGQGGGQCMRFVRCL